MLFLWEKHAIKEHATEFYRIVIPSVYVKVVDILMQLSTHNINIFKN